METAAFSDPAQTRVTSISLAADEKVPGDLRDKCAAAASLGLQLMACFPHLDRLVLVFQKPLAYEGWRG